jgi:hypothetical protein
MNYDMKLKINDILKSIKDKHVIMCIWKADLINAGKRRYSCNKNVVFFNLLNVSNENLSIVSSIIDAPLLNIKDDDEIEL